MAHSMRTANSNTQDYTFIIIIIDVCIICIQ